jgi:hypothetical protein
MVGEYIRRFLYVITLALMGVTLWVANWANQLQGQARDGWVDAPAVPAQSPAIDR